MSVSIVLRVIDKSNKNCWRVAPSVTIFSGLPEIRWQSTWTWHVSRMSLVKQASPIVAGADYKEGKEIDNCE